jgi:hypothetical protein
MSRRAVERDNPTYAQETVSRVYANAGAERGESWVELDEGQRAPSPPPKFQKLEVCNQADCRPVTRFGEDLGEYDDQFFQM